MSHAVAFLRVWHPTDVAAVVVDVAVLAGWSASVGYLMHRVPVARFARDGWLTRLRPWEDGGRFWLRWTHLRRWKRHLPDAGGVFAGGFPKRHLGARDPSHLARFSAETRRAELVHWIVPAIAPLFFLWNPWWLAAVMVAYLVVANGPCLVVQRYNRARLERVLARVQTSPGR